MQMPLLNVWALLTVPDKDLCHSDWSVRAVEEGDIETGQGRKLWEAWV